MAPTSEVYASLPCFNRRTGRKAGCVRSMRLAHATQQKRTKRVSTNAGTLHICPETLCSNGNAHTDSSRISRQNFDRSVTGCNDSEEKFMHAIPRSQEKSYKNSQLKRVGMQIRACCLPSWSRALQQDAGSCGTKSWASGVDAQVRFMKRQKDWEPLIASLEHRRTKTDCLSLHLPGQASVDQSTLP